MEIRKALPGEFEAVRNFYFAVIDGFEGKSFHPAWQKDVYPAPEELRQLIGQGELYVGTENGVLVAAMALNHSCNAGYRQVPWTVAAEDSQVYVIHMLAVLPSRSRSGLGGEMVRFAAARAREQQGKAIRLDVLKGNIPANRLYEAAGFRKKHTLTMYYPDTGYTDFELYELPL